MSSAKAKQGTLQLAVKARACRRASPRAAARSLESGWTVCDSGAGAGGAQCKAVSAVAAWLGVRSASRTHLLHSTGGRRLRGGLNVGHRA